MCCRLDGDQVVQRTLRTRRARPGRGSDEVVEVLQGLADGDRVLAGSLGAVRDGTSVRLAGAEPPADAASAQPAASAAR